MNGGSQAAPGVEALLALCTGPRDLYDLFRPMGIFFTGKNKIDADRDLVTILTGGRAKMRISLLDNTMCREGECAPFSLWLVYQQKYADVIESANQDGTLDKAFLHNTDQHRRILLFVEGALWTRAAKTSGRCNSDNPGKTPFFEKIKILHGDIRMTGIGLSLTWSHGPDTLSPTHRKSAQS